MISVLTILFQVIAQNDLDKIMKLGEALLLNLSIEKDMKESFVMVPHSLRASFIEICGPELVYTPLFHEKMVCDGFV